MLPRRAQVALVALSSCSAPCGALPVLPAAVCSKGLGYNVEVYLRPQKFGASVLTCYLPLQDMCICHTPGGSVEGHAARVLQPTDEGSSRADVLGHASCNGGG
jgi:hypothetical protein